MMANQTDHTPPSASSGDAKSDKTSKQKRRKLNECILIGSTPNVNIHRNLYSVDKGRMPCNSTPKEHVLLLPPRLTKSAYPILLSCHVAPRAFHLEGRFGSRTHKIDKFTNGIPVLIDQNTMEELSKTSSELQQLVDTEGVSIVEKEFVQNHRTKQDVPVIDARIHPELEPSDFIALNATSKCIDETLGKSNPAFTYAEMFGGVGGFGVALERLGGKCLFYSELDERCQETYALNFDTPSNCIHGDIHKVPDEALPQNLDLLVGGFPCQPFTTLGGQPGFGCEKGRGQLFLQIVRVLSKSKPKAFLFENVPGLLGMKETLETIVKAFRGAGYSVTAEVCSARGLTATNRKRLFLVGLRTDLVVLNKQENSSSSPFDSSFFQFPYIPDLKLCSHDILDYDTLPASELEVLRLSQSTLNQLSQNRRWKPNHLAWPNVTCDTLTSHYGNAVGRGESQLVPSSAPNPPRRFSVRECARVMGFPNAFQFCDIQPDQGEMAYRKEGYRMIGNAVCPPLIAALAGSTLDAAGVEMGKELAGDLNWTLKGRRVAVDLACSALRSDPVDLPAGCLIKNHEKDG